MKLVVFCCSRAELEATAMEEQPYRNPTVQNVCPDRSVSHLNPNQKTPNLNTDALSVSNTCVSEREREGDNWQSTQIVQKQ